jgi:predicted DNA-binding protein
MMEIATDNEAFPLPPTLLAQVHAVAEEEHRSSIEIVREAVERYLESRRRENESSASAAEKARAFEAWVRSHPYTPPLADEAIRRENLVRDVQ